MQTIYSSADPIMAGFIEGVLRDVGISAHVLQAGLYGAAGELPPTECLARIVVVHPEQAERARRIVREYLEPDAQHDFPDWTCPRCGEISEGQFTQCWQCAWENVDAPVQETHDD